MAKNLNDTERKNSHHHTEGSSMLSDYVLDVKKRNSEVIYCIADDILQGSLRESVSFVILGSLIRIRTSATVIARVCLKIKDLKSLLTAFTGIYRMSISYAIYKIKGSGGGIAMYVKNVVSFMIILVLVRCRGSRPRPIGA